MKSARKIELLAPARDAETGIEAINHGADAVYIGAPKFSARAAAGNSIDEIRRLTDYAHIFHAKVYVALNTILKDDELSEAEKIACACYDAGVDALIVQDMGILQLNIPPIALHASTQCDNRDPAKIRFLEQAGFSQVVLARELSLGDIQEIALQTQMRLEVFVHGALCTSFSGQCYISQALAGRSANRGECAQFCRLPYNLLDANGKTLIVEKHLLSLKDLNRSEYLEELLDAGVSSFKIEGRLKDITYVKNTTAYYRRKLDALFARRTEYIKASSGESVTYFTPNLQKTFNRGFTDGFLHGRSRNISSAETPKSVGETVGSVSDLSAKYFRLKGSKQIHNGDGLCFFNERKILQGFRVNRAEGDKIFPAEMPRLHVGLVLYRNLDFEFEKTLLKKSAERKIATDWTLEETDDGFALSVVDSDGYTANYAIVFAKERAKSKQTDNIREQISRLGNTPFCMEQFFNKLTDSWFIPSSLLSEMRRNVAEQLLETRKKAFHQQERNISHGVHPYPATQLPCTGNVLNRQAEIFYRQHGVESIAPAFEAQSEIANFPLMTSKYCIKYELGYCPKNSKKSETQYGELHEPLYLTTGKHRLRLKFDCGRCEMEVN